MSGGLEIPLELAGLSTCRGHDINLRRPVVSDKICNLTPVGGKARTMRTLGYQARIAAEGRDHVNATSGPLRTEGDSAAVWGKRRIGFVSRIASKTDGVATADLLRPYVEVPFAVAIGGIREELSVGR